MKVFFLTFCAAVWQTPERTDFSAAAPAEAVNKAKTYLRPALGAEMFIIFRNDLITASAVILPEKLLYIFQKTSG
jgi:hypothetical protein